MTARSQVPWRRLFASPRLKPTANANSHWQSTDYRLSFDTGRDSPAVLRLSSDASSSFNWLVGQLDNQALQRAPRRFADEFAFVGSG